MLHYVAARALCRNNLLMLQLPELVTRSSLLSRAAQGSCSGADTGFVTKGYGQLLRKAQLRFTAKVNAVTEHHT